MIFHKKKTWRRPKKVAKQQYCGSGPRICKSLYLPESDPAIIKQNSRKNLDF